MDLRRSGQLSGGFEFVGGTSSLYPAKQLPPPARPHERLRPPAPTPPRPPARASLERERRFQAVEPLQPGSQVAAVRGLRPPLVELASRDVHVVVRELCSMDVNPKGSPRTSRTTSRRCHKLQRHNVGGNVELLHDWTAASPRIESDHPGAVAFCHGSELPGQQVGKSEIVGRDDYLS